MERFWNKVDRCGSNECWEWRACRDQLGYGRIGAFNGRRNERAHRAAWTLECGPIPDGLCVLHHCDNRACVNPRHLYIGTQRRNIQDMVDRGRQRGAVGERNAHSKLTREQVAEIRRRYMRGKPWHPGNKIQLAEEFGISTTMVLLIISGRCWKEA